MKFIFGSLALITMLPQYHIISYICVDISTWGPNYSYNLQKFCGFENQLPNVMLSSQGTAVAQWLRCCATN